MAEMTLRQFRDKYPQYDDMSDQEVADKLYESYSDMPKDEFYKKLDYKPQTTQAAPAAKTSFMDKLTSGSKKAYGYAQDVAGGFNEGLLKLITTINQDPHPEDFEQFYKGSGQEGLSHNIARGLGKGTVSLVSAGESLPAQITMGGLVDATSAPPGEKIKSFIESVATGSLLPAGLKGLEFLRPSKRLAKNIKPSELLENFENAKGFKAPLGDIVKSPFIKNAFESYATSFPGTGAVKAIKDLKEQLNESGSAVVNKFKNDLNDAGILAKIRTGLDKAKKDTKSILNQKKDLLNSKAEELGLNVGKENQAQTAKDILEEIKQDPIRSEKLSRENPGVINDLNLFSKNTEPESLRNADINRPYFYGDKAKQFGKSDDTYLQSLYLRMKDASEKDLENFLGKLDNPEISNLRDDYRRFYAENYAPFRDPEIRKFLKTGKGDTDLIIKNFLRTGKETDRIGLLKKLTDKLTPEQHDLVTYSYFRNALNSDGSLNFPELKRLNKNLGPEQRKELFKHHPEELAQLNKVMKNYQLGEDAFLAEKNVPTGKRLKDWAPLIAAGSGAKGGFALGGPLGALAGAALGVGATSGGGKLVTSLATNEKLRSNLVKSMLENKSKFTNPALEKLSAYLSQALINNQPNKGANNGR